MLFKPTSFTIIMLSAMLLSGCNQNQTPSTQKTTAKSATSATMSATAVTTQNTVADTHTAQALLTVLSGLMFKDFNENPTQTLTPAQKTCLAKLDYHEQLPNFQRYLQSKLTVDELTKTNQYYALPVGQKQIQLARQQLFAIKDKKITNSIQLTDDEKLQIQAFQGTPEGKKLAELLSPQNQTALFQTLTQPMTQKAMADCQIKPAEIAALEKMVSSASSTQP